MLAGHSVPGGQIDLHPTATTEGNVSRPLSTQALHSISVDFSYSLQERKEVSVSRTFRTQPLHSISSGFSYTLQQRRRVVLAGPSAPTPSRSDSLTSYSSEGGQC